MTRYEMMMNKANLLYAKHLEQKERGNRQMAIIWGHLWAGLIAKIGAMSTGQAREIVS